MATSEIHTSTSSSLQHADQTTLNTISPVLFILFGVVATIALAIVVYDIILIKYCQQEHNQSAIHPIAEDIAPSIHDEGAAAGDVRTSSSEGLDPKALEAIPIIRYSDRTRDFFNINQTAECVVCLGKLERGEQVRWLPSCSHAFHVPCIDNWLQAHPNCPTCRALVALPQLPLIPLLLFTGRGTNTSSLHENGVDSQRTVAGSGIDDGSEASWMITRTSSGGWLRRQHDTNKILLPVDEEEVGDLVSVRAELKRSLSLDHSCVIIAN